MSNVPQKSTHKVPKEFLCPISKQFMNDPVISPSTNRTYNRKSLIALREGTLRVNDHNGVLPPENEGVLPNHNLRRSIAAWRRGYKLASPFSYISTLTDLEAAVNSLLDIKENKLTDFQLLQYLVEFSSAIQRKYTIVESKEGFLLLSKLIAGCPLETTAELCQWVKISVALLSNAHNFNNELDIGEDQHKLLAVLDKVSGDINGATFQLGLINLIHSLMASNVQIINHSGVVRALSSFVLKPGHRLSASKEHFDKLFYMLLDLWGTNGALGLPRLSQALASLVWPMPESMDGAQYEYLLQTISTRLKNQVEGQTHPLSLPLPLEAMTRTGLVNRIFCVLDYATLPQGAKQSHPDGWLWRGELTSLEAEELVFKRCFEILECLSTTIRGRLEIVRVITRSGYSYLPSFYSALALNILPRLMESHVIPAISVIFNVLIHSRYISVVNKMSEDDPNYQRFLGLIDDGHPRVAEISAQIYSIYDRISSEETFPNLKIY